MPWSVLFCEEFDEEFEAMPVALQDVIYSHVGILKEAGPSLGRPWVDTLQDSNFPNMKELRFDWNKGVWRVAFAFDPERQAVLLVGADKRGVNQKRFYKDLVRKAEDRYRKHLRKWNEDISHGKNS